MKNKTIKKLITIFLSSVIIFSNSYKISFAENSKVVYEDISNKIVTLPGEDLFLNFKKIMPGEVVQQDIEIHNKNKSTVELFLRAEPADNDKFESKELQDISEELINILKLKLILQVEGKEDRVIYSGTASGIKNKSSEDYGYMTENILLGEFKANSKANIIAELSVPEELKNKYQNAESKVKWIFSCNTLSSEVNGGTAEDTSNKNVITGDKSSIILISILAGSSLIVLVFVMMRKKKNN